jgi:hypothetical protein
VRHISAFRSFSGFIIALRNIPEKFVKRNYISVLLLYNYNVFLNTIISYALFLVLFAYQEALKFPFILSVIFWRLVMFLVFSNYICDKTRERGLSVSMGV